MKFFNSIHIQLNQTKFSKAIKASRTDHGGKPAFVEGGTTKRRSSRLMQPVGSIVDSNGQQRSARQSSRNQSKQNPISKVNNTIRFMRRGKLTIRVKNYRTVRTVLLKKKEVNPNSSLSSVQQVEKELGSRTVRGVSLKKKEVGPNSSISGVQTVEKKLGRRTVRVVSSKKQQFSSRIDSFNRMIPPLVF